MADDIEGDFKQIKISRLTLGLIMSVAVTSGVIVWNAAQVAGRIGELEDTVNRVEADMNDLSFETDPTILIRLDSLETKIDELADMDHNAELTSRIVELEEWIDELDRDNGEELRWELDDLHHRSYAFEEALRSRTWGDEILREFLGW
jgi:transcriptional regulator with XRE-family HTH domain|tara:strand:- start:440 stop:883 length:444 start_codon:yes stop_codon:yes gene_type:complete